VLDTLDNRPSEVPNKKLKIKKGTLEILCQSDRITYSKGKRHEREI